MGAQQILLIVLGVIIVGVAVFIGLQTSSVIVDQAILDLALIRFQEIGSLANKYKATPEELGGGAGSYIGFELPKSYIEKDELSWTYRVWPKKDKIDFYLITTSKNYSGRPFYIWGGFKQKGLYMLHVFDPEKNKWQKLVHDQ